MKSLMDVVRKDRSMPFLKRGMKVKSTHTNEFGVITGGNASCNINVRWGDRKYSTNNHPKWKIIYYSKDEKIIAKYDENGKEINKNPMDWLTKNRRS